MCVCVCVGCSIKLDDHFIDTIMDADAPLVILQRPIEDGGHTDNVMS